MKLKIITSLLAMSLAITNCTDLEEKYGGNLTESQVANDEQSIDALLTNLDNALMAAFQIPFGGVTTMSQVTTDELIVPTRGTNWYDNGQWQQLHQHRWNGDHAMIIQGFNDLNGVVFAATNILRFSPTAQQEATARFYRALAMYWLLDFFDQVPYRDPGESTLLQARVRKGLEALEYIISEINDVMENLPDIPVTLPNKDGAKVLLMKCYLNKGVYKNRESPTFPESDMNEVIRLADEVINSNRYSFSNNYFDNFAPNNGTTGKENILTQENVGGGVFSGLAFHAFFALHYNNTPSGVNGWSILSDFYDKFESGDLRRGQAYQTPDSPPNPGNRINVGFLVGQQYDLFTDKPLKDLAGVRPLIFTREVEMIEVGSDLETTGIRPQKYAWDWINHFQPDNDWVYFRLPDVLLMKAEAILREGNATAGPYGSTALELVNSIRQHASRGASALSAIDLNILLDERGRELWLECWRRQDMIRFGKFLDPFQEKDYDSDATYLLFPIPNQQLAVNENLIQNPGY